MHVLITFYDPWTIPTVTFTRTDPVARAEIPWDPKRPTEYIGAHAACKLAFEYDFKSDFPFCGGALHFLILYFYTCFHSGFRSNKIRHVSPQNKKEEKLERRTRGNSQKLQQSKFRVGERKKHSWQSQQYWKRLPGKIGQSRHFWRFSKGSWAGSWKTSSVLEACFLLSREYSILSHYLQLLSKPPLHNFSPFQKKKKKKAGGGPGSRLPRAGWAAKDRAGRASRKQAGSRQSPGLF